VGAGRLEATVPAAQPGRRRRHPGPAAAAGEDRKRLLTRKAFGARPGNRWGEDGWKQEELALLGALPDDEVAVREVEEAAWAHCSAIDARLGEGAVKELLAWHDATPRADALAVLLGEVELEMMMRMLRQAAEATGRSA
jgi:hypothetical protein